VLKDCRTPGPTACLKMFWSTMVPTLVENFHFFSIHEKTIIMIMVEIQYSGTALLLLVNPWIPHQNDGNACPSYCLKGRRFVASYVQPQYESITVFLQSK